jgi:hypothetical protein
MVESFVQPGENPDWSDQPPTQNPPGWRDTWRPKKQRKRRARAAAAQSYPEPQTYAAPYAQPAPEPAYQYQPPPAPPPVPAAPPRTTPQYPLRTPARDAYPFRPRRDPRVFAAPEVEDDLEAYAPLAVPDAPEGLGRPDPLRQVVPYPEMPLIEQAADNARVRPRREYMQNWRNNMVIRPAPGIAELARESARVPLQPVDFTQITRARASRAGDAARDRIDTFRNVLKNNPFI